MMPTNSLSTLNTSFFWKHLVLCYFCWVVTISICYANVGSPNGTINFDVQSDQLTEMKLTEAGLAIGPNLTPAANLHVQGQAIISNQLFVGGSSGSSNLNINGTAGFGTTTVSSNTTLGNQYLVLVDTSSGNITLTLPDLSNINGRNYRIKKLTLANNVIIQREGVLIDNSERVILQNGSAGSVELMGVGNRWYVMSMSGSANLSEEVIMVTKFDNTNQVWTNPLRDTPLILNSYFGSNVIYKLTRGRGTNGGDDDTGFLSIGSDNGIGFKARSMDDIDSPNNLPAALTIANNPNGVNSEGVGMYIEFTLTPSSSLWNYLRMDLTIRSTGLSSSTFGYAVLFDANANGYDAGDELGRITGTFQSANKSTSMDLSSLILRSSTTFRIYFWENYHDGSAFNQQASIGRISIYGSPAP